jgi:hypothetical protein
MGYLEQGIHNQMNITKTISRVLVVAVLFGTLFAIAAPQPVEALTKAQQRACRDKWAGNYLASSQKVKNYRNSNCDTSKDGNCTAKNNRVPNPSTGEEEIRTTITCPVSSGGGDTDEDETSDGCASLEEKGGTSIIDCKVDGGNPIMSILIQVINFLAVGVGIAVVGGIIWGGMMYASSNGDAGKTKQAVTIIVNAVVGLLLFIFMYALINFLVPGGAFN